MEYHRAEDQLAFSRKVNLRVQAGSLRRFAPAWAGVSNSEKNLAPRYRQWLSVVREFWDARNPTPGAETNSYKEGSGADAGKRIGRPKAPASQFKLPLELRGS
jgi:hypothetical protein